MGGYVVNFTVYTMAMIGLICFAVFVYKKIMDGSIRKDSSKFLSLEESMSISPRKTLHVVRAGNEKFLIASDIDRTTLISKLESSSSPILEKTDVKNFEEILNIQEIVKQQKQPEVYVAEQLPPVVDIQNRPVRRRDRSGMSVNFPKPAKSEYSPMQEMARRINEL